MTESTKKMNIINRLKTFVSKAGSGALWHGAVSEYEISEKIARKIQKNSYELSQRQVRDSFTPPYISLLEQLEVEDEQIFKAAVYNLSNIAQMRPVYRAKIASAFSHFVQDTSQPENFRNFVSGHLRRIKK